MILVTGGTGLVGSHLLYHLCQSHHKVVAIYRNSVTQNNTKDIFKLYGKLSYYEKIIWKKADITDIPALTEVFKDITHVYHAAAMVSFATKHKSQLKKINTEGTANVVNLCLQNKIKKLCYVSSIATLSKKIGSPKMDETCDWNPEGDHSDYSLSKFGGEMEVWRGSQEGLKVVMVNPGVIFGFGMWQVNTGKLFCKIKKGLPFYTKGITGVVAVQDVVTAMIKLMDSDVNNQRFVLVNQNMSYQKTFGLIASCLHTQKPNINIPKWVTEIAWRIDAMLSFVSFNLLKTNLSKHGLKALHQKRYYDGSAITKNIPFNYTPFEASIQEIADKLP